VSDRIGDVTLRLPGSETYRIDAQTRVGNVKSEFGGSSSRILLVGDRLEASGANDAHRVDLKVGIGGIQIYKLREEP
jgi:hypothetical protein